MVASFFDENVRIFPHEHCCKYASINISALCLDNKIRIFIFSSTKFHIIA